MNLRVAATKTATTKTMIPRPASNHPAPSAPALCALRPGAAAGSSGISSDNSGTAFSEDRLHRLVGRPRTALSGICRSANISQEIGSRNHHGSRRARGITCRSIPWLARRMRPSSRDAPSRLPGSVRETNDVLVSSSSCSCVSLASWIDAAAARSRSLAINVEGCRCDCAPCEFLRLTDTIGSQSGSVRTRGLQDRLAIELGS